MKFMIPLIVLAFSSVSLAENIKCTFTEPFLTTTYNSETGKITIENPDHGKATVPVKVEFTQNGTLILSSAKISQTLEIFLIVEGSDGMSDFVYPFEGVINGYDGGVDGKLFGGCESDKLKKK